MRFFTYLLSCLLLSFSLLAQDKSDVILKTNGDELKGKVLDITDTDVKFSYAGETLTYNIKKADIIKITFSSGRVEKFDGAGAAPAAADNSVAVSTGDPHNKVAVLPFTVTQDGVPASDELGMEVQNEIHAYLSKHAGVYTLLDPRRTNVLLNKAGITKATIMNYTMDEICKALNVEYIIDGMVTQTRTTQTSYGSSSGTSKDKPKSDKTVYSGSTYSTNTQNYANTTELRIYNNTGKNIYNQNRRSLLSDQDSYKSTIEYLLKRCPLYAK